MRAESALDVAPASLRLSIDAVTLRHLAVDVRGLVRYRLDNDGPGAIDSASLTSTLSGVALPDGSAVGLSTGHAAVLALHVTPTIAGFHELAGELSVEEKGAERRYSFAGVHVRAGGEGPQVNVVHIDQSAARVVDNSRSSFGVEEVGGIVGDGEWQPVALTAIVEAEAPSIVPTPAFVPQPVAFTIKTETATYEVTTTLAAGEISTIYAGHVRGSEQEHVALKIADDTSDNDLLQHEMRVLGMLAAASEAPDGPIVHIAKSRDQFRTSDGRLGTVFDKLDGFDLTHVRDRFRARGEPGLPPKHLIWVLRRSLAALGLAHKAGILHGNVDPAHILVRPHDHNLWVVDWCWAVVNPARTGQGFKVINEAYSAPEVRDRGRPTPASDLYALGKCAIHVVGGDPETKALPEMDPRLARFLKYLTVESQGGRPQDAWELYRQVEHMRKQIWGAHEFVPLVL